MTASITAAAVAALPAGGEVAVTGGGQLADALRSRLGPRIAPEHDPVRAVIDTTGDPEVIAASLARLDDLGTLVLARPATPGPAALDLYADLHVRGLTVVGIPGG